MLSFLDRFVSITLKTRIRYKDKEYSSPNDLPSEVCSAYEKAIAEGKISKKILFNGQKFTNEDAMPRDVRKLCDDVMSVIENNGQVTLPNNRRTEPLLTKREVLVVAFCLWSRRTRPRETCIRLNLSPLRAGESAFLPARFRQNGHPARSIELSSELGKTLP
jgi:hypothetical protein